MVEVYPEGGGVPGTSTLVFHLGDQGERQVGKVRGGGGTATSAPKVPAKDTQPPPQKKEEEERTDKPAGSASGDARTETFPDTGAVEDSRDTRALW